MRNQFPIFEKHPELVYFDSAATAQKPKCVIDALASFYAEEYGTVHRAIYKGSLLATEKYNATREAARKFLNAEHLEEIVFTRGTTDALNLIALSWGRTHLKKGDEICVSEKEHHSNFVPWQMLAEEKGLTLVPEITPQTRLVAVAHMTNVTGEIRPIAAIVQEAKKVGAIVVVDGAQAAPHLKIDVQALGCDFYAFSSHKCYGPTGVGILYGKKELLESMPPVIGGGDMIHQVSVDKTTFAAPPLRFEAGTPIIGSVIALRSALDFLALADKTDENKLRILLEEQLQEIEGLRILGESSDKGPLTTFTIEGVHPLDVATLLDLKNIAIRSGHLCAQPCLRSFGLEAALRVSFGLYNTVEEVHYFLEELRKAVCMLRG
jgi:cysteine desulfurase/selenocysteine lyase